MQPILKYPGAKMLYLIHPISGSGTEKERTQNISEIRRLSRMLSNQGYNVISPYYVYGYLDDTIPEERTHALKCCLQLLETVHEGGGQAIVFGDWENSEGCKMELRLCQELGIRIKGDYE